MNDKIIIDRMDAEEFYRMLMDDAKRVRTQKYQFFTTPKLLENRANDFRELCGGKTATDDWEA